MRRFDATSEGLHLRAVGRVAGAGLSNEKPGEDVPGYATDFHPVLGDEALSACELRVVEIADFFVPQKLQFGVFKAELIHHVECVLEFAADAVANDS